ncbi:RNA polymerase sigma factor [Arenimonas soli]|uniref:RNA polymerase sigma factor n=1 Tax=Arenimonas soli TaxID=2269504 RepID=A0ABQ1HFH5_9GAMM|nr:sigma-70 family RNA polymerase sigma factor [Arenimonas soli]GGA73752.1 RNA polymerase sigma factor [Arenimonas soli]
MDDDAGLDARLVEAAALGDMPAFECLVRRHQGVVRALMRRLTDHATADDLCQATFLLAWQKLAGFRGGSFRAWLCTIAYRLNAKQQRRRKQGQDDETDLPDPDQAQALGPRIDLDHAISALPPAQRHAIVLSSLGGLSHGEIADLTGWPLGTVKSHVQRAKRRLRDALEGYADEQ